MSSPTTFWAALDDAPGAMERRVSKPLRARVCAGALNSPARPGAAVFLDGARGSRRAGAGPQATARAPICEDVFDDVAARRQRV